jgi:hypothetical protein
VVRKQYTPGWAAALPGLMRLTQGNSGDALAIGVGGNGDLKVLRGAREALFGAAQALHDGGHILGAARLGQSGLQLGQCGLQAAGLGRVDGTVLFFACA